MKASEVVKLYQQGERDFRRVNLRGQSFKGQDLSGADFSEADIRGTNFKGAILRGVKFRGAKAGLQKRWAITLVFISWLISALSGFLLGFIANQISHSIFSNPIENQIVSWIALTILVLFYFIVIGGGSGLFAGVVTGVFIVIVILIATAFFNIALVGVIIGTIGFAFVVAIAGVFAVVIAVAGDQAGAVAVALAVVGTVVGALTGTLAGALAVAGPLVGTVVSAYLCKRAIKEDPREVWIRIFALILSSILGTSFYDADLTDADFTGTTLKSTDLRAKSLTRACWKGTIKLDLARVGKTLLSQKKVRKLLISCDGCQKSYVGKNLRGANLVRANLNKANLKFADLSEATFVAANLDGANLTEVNAVETDFTKASMTGACLEAWNIESNTKLDQVDCQYVYLLENPKPGTDDRERRPSSGVFQPGEFTKLFEEVLDTVDFIFRNGVDWKAFVAAFKKVQVENEDTPLQIQSIENKGDGVVVVKVKVPPDTDKEKIHQDFNQNYELALQAVEEKYKALLAAKEEQIEDKEKQIEDKDRQIEDYLQRDRQRSADMMEITKLLASKPINVEAKAVAGDNYNISGNIGIGVNKGDVKEGAKVAGVINEAPQQDLAQAAAEIQKLLKQLEESYPTNTTTEQMIVATKAIERIESNPDWKKRAVNALKQGSLKALETHPIGAFVVGAIKGWQEAES